MRELTNCELGALMDEKGERNRKPKLDEKIICETDLRIDGFKNAAGVTYTAHHLPTGEKITWAGEGAFRRSVALATLAKRIKGLGDVEG